MNRCLASLLYFLFLLCTCLHLEASVPTSIQLLGPREGDPASIVEGVSTIYGDYSEFDVDAVVAGPDPLILSRLYSSNDTLENGNFGGWRFLSKCNLTLKQDPKRKSYSTSEGTFERTYVRIGTDEGSILTYVGWQNKTNPEATSIYKVDVEDEAFSMANTSRGWPQETSNQKNNELYYYANGDFFELLLCNHGKRVYTKHPSHHCYLLERESLPSGNKIFYEYDEEGCPTTIKMTNAAEEKVLSWIKIEHGQVSRAETSDGKSIKYHFEGDQPLLVQVSSTHKPLAQGGLAAPVGWPVLVHGLDQFVTGMSAAITGKHRTTLTEQVLQSAGVSSEWASFTNNILSLGGTMGGTAVIRARQLAAFPNFRLPPLMLQNEQKISTLSHSTLSKSWTNSINPFKGKTFQEIDQMLRAKGFITKGPNPLHGKGSYFSPTTNRKYYLDHAGKTYRGGITELPHVDVHYNIPMNGIEKQRFPIGEYLYGFE